MGNEYKIFQKVSKKCPTIVLDYSQAVLMYELEESLKIPKTVFSENEAAEYLRIRLQTLKNYAKKRKITWSLVGKQKVYTKMELDNFLERRSRLHRDF